MHTCPPGADADEMPRLGFAWRGNKEKKGKGVVELPQKKNYRKMVKEAEEHVSN